MKQDKQSLFDWLQELNPQNQIRVSEMLFGTVGGVLTGFVLYQLIPHPEAVHPLVVLLLLGTGVIGLYQGFRHWRNSWF